MRIDLSRPLVASMGQHDAPDGYPKYQPLRATAGQLPASKREPNLEVEYTEFAAMLEQGDWATADPLGIGGLPINAHRAVQMLEQRALSDTRPLRSLLTAALAGLRYHAARGELRQPAEYRFAFRELGLAIAPRGLGHLYQTVHRSTQPDAAGARWCGLLQPLMSYAPTREDIESFWRNPEHRRTTTWPEHRDINDVMLATTLVPDGFLDLPPLPGSPRSPVNRTCRKRHRRR